MSHVRNLLHRPLERPSDRSAGPTPPAVTNRIDNVGAPHNAFRAVASRDTTEDNRDVLSTVPVVHAEIDRSSRLVAYTDPRSPGADRYRLLRMRLRERATSGNLSKILITSALPQDGKSTVTMNLATVLSERGKRPILVIEGDMHRPCLGDRLSLQTTGSLADCLQDGLSPMSALQRVEPLGWYFMPSGEPRKNPTELLQSPALAGVVQRLSPYFDWILVDSPPVISITDALLLQQHVDASLLVVRAGQTPQAMVEQAYEVLGKKKLVGVVLNGISKSDKKRYGYYYSKAASR